MKTKSSRKEIRKKDASELFIFMAAGYLVIFIITLPLNDLLASLKLSFTYFFLVFLPFLPAIACMKLSIMEKFLLTNLAGLSYAGLFVVLDVIFKIPLTKAVYLGAALICLSASLVFYMKS